MLLHEFSLEVTDLSGFNDWHVIAHLEDGSRYGIARPTRRACLDLLRKIEARGQIDTAHWIPFPPVYASPAWVNPAAMDLSA